MDLIGDGVEHADQEGEPCHTKRRLAGRDIGPVVQRPPDEDGEDRVLREVGDLSGGEQQRVVLLGGQTWQKPMEERQDKARGVLARSLVTRGDENQSRPDDRWEPILRET